MRSVGVLLLRPAFSCLRWWGATFFFFFFLSSSYHTLYTQPLPHLHPLPPHISEFKKPNKKKIMLKKTVSRAAAAAAAPTGTNVPSKAKVVVVGGGIVGHSVGYHLAKAGWKDVVVLEKGVATCGTTWHAAGLVGQLRGTAQETLLSRMGAATFRELEAETEQGTGFKQHGSITLSRTADRTTLLRRNAARAPIFGIEAEMITPEDAASRFPTIDPSVFDSALWLPGDGVASPTDATNAFMKGMRKHGGRLCERTSVSGFSKNPITGKVTTVHTNNGDIECEHVVNCAGLWGQQVGQMAGVNVPLHPCEHFYVVTTPVKGVHGELPVLRDPDRWAYYREWSEGLVLGAFEVDAKPCFVDGPPDNFEFQLFEDDYEHFMPVMEAAFEAMPVLADTPIRTMVNGPESFTPDNQYILGLSHECSNFWVAAGMNSSGIASSAGAGYALAKWMTDRPPFDMNAVDIRRFGGFTGSQNFVRTRSTETLGCHYKIPYPRAELEKGRPLRWTPVYDRLLADGAVMGSKFGWERATYFAPKGTPPHNGTFGKPDWQDIVDAEYRHTLNEVSIFDITSFAKFNVQGKDATALVNYVSAAQMDVPVGRVVYTPILDAKGGYFSDLTITRVAHDEYQVITSTALAIRDLMFFREAAEAKDFSVGIVDVSSAYGLLSLQGPKANEVLAKLNPKVDWAGSALPASHSIMTELGSFYVRVSRVSYVGEPAGVEICVTMEMMAGLYDTIMGASDNVKNGGYYCLEAMRIAAGYRHWASEMTTDQTPFEAGTAFTVDFSKEDGIAGTILKERKGVANMTSRIVSIKLAEGNPAVLWGGEPILRDGKIVGVVTSGVYAGPLNASVGLASIKKGDGEPITKSFIEKHNWEVNIAGEIHPVNMSLKAPRAM